MDPATTEWLLTAMERLVMCGAAISIGVAQWVMRELFHMQDGWYTFPVSVLLAVVVLAVIAGVIKLVNLPINGAPGYNWMWIMLSVGGALPPVAAIIRQFGNNAPAHQFEVTQGGRLCLSRRGGRRGGLGHMRWMLSLGRPLAEIGNVFALPVVCAGDVFIRFCRGNYGGVFAGDHVPLAVHRVGPAAGRRFDVIGSVNPAYFDSCEQQRFGRLEQR